MEKWKYQPDKKRFAGAELKDLRDTIYYQLFIAKLNAYGFDKNSLELIYSYKKHRKQRVTYNTTFSIWTELLSSVPQGSVLGPLLSNIYLNELLSY